MAETRRNELIYSADGHIDVPCLPPGLFVENARAALRGRMPHVVESDAGGVWVTDQGARFGLAGYYMMRGDFGRAFCEIPIEQCRRHPGHHEIWARNATFVQLERNCDTFAFGCRHRDQEGPVVRRRIISDGAAARRDR